MTVKPPIPFSPDVEHPEAEEAETGEALNASFREILETTSQDYGHAVRAVHAKAHGFVEGTLQVQAGLPPELAQGLFAGPGSYPAILRFSTNPGDILDDSISVPRGLAIKVIGVEGERLPGSEGDATQDFVLVNGPAFATATGKEFLANLKLLAKTTDKAEWAKKGLSAVLRGANTALSAVGIESSKIQTLGGAPQVHPLGETYFSQTPFLYGSYVTKFQVVPVSPNLTALTGTTIDASGRPDALREEIAARMVEGDAVWELRVQLQRDRERQPVEDASALWDEEEAPFVTVAILRAPAQSSWSHRRGQVGDDSLSFSVWHGLAAHRPLGSINRLRKSAYERSAAFRADFNGCPVHEPRAAVNLPA